MGVVRMSSGSTCRTGVVYLKVFANIFIRARDVRIAVRAYVQKYHLRKPTNLVSRGAR